MLTIIDPVSLWFEGGVPVRMVWRGQRLRVTDSPTELTRQADELPPSITHAPIVRAGWRFQAADETGVNRVFDVRSGDNGSNRVDGRNGADGSDSGDSGSDGRNGADVRADGASLLERVYD